MKIGILGDTHSNLPALEAVMKKVKELSLDAVFFSGDAVGYGPWPGETIDILKENVRAGVLGNHDAGVVGKTDITDYYDAIRYVINWTTDSLTNDQFGFLDRLKYIYTESEYGEFLLSHGSPRMPERYDYIFTSKGVNRLFEVEPFLKRVNFVGHSHHMNVFAMTGKDTSVEMQVTDNELDINFSHKVICVVGSVGQPRDGDPRAGFVVYDTEKKTLRFYRVDYDFEKTIKKIKDLRLPNSFGERLRNGD